MRHLASTKVNQLITEFASPYAEMPTSYSDQPITYIAWLEHEHRRISNRVGGVAIVSDPKTGFVALAYVALEHAEQPN
tara:strand:+ start:3659 stop:3892 length:234 start_codon:yes stop_codon:yes gene_type:complete